MNNRRNLLVNKSDEEFVDLGLPSGLKWAKGNLKKSGNTCVIGEETDYGDFWSWANVGLTNDTGWMDSEGGVMTKEMYNTTAGARQTAGISRTDATHNVAYKYLGAPWRLPTRTEFDELAENTDHEWTTIDGINGVKFMNKNDHSVYVFFPTSGRCGGSGLTQRGSSGYYWSSTYYNSDYAYCMIVISSGVSPINYGSDYLCHSVRPVCN